MGKFFDCKHCAHLETEEEIGMFRDIYVKYKCKMYNKELKVDLFSALLTLHCCKDCVNDKYEHFMEVK